MTRLWPLAALSALVILLAAAAEGLWVPALLGAVVLARAVHQALASRARPSDEATRQERHRGD
jgi:hypothetical protein